MRRTLMILLVGCSSWAQPPAIAPDGGALIQPGVGLREFPLGQATRKDFEKKLGAPTEVVPHGTYTTSLVYASGLEATYCQNDPRQVVRWLSVCPPFNASVDAGDCKGVIVLGRTTLREVRALLGPCEWETTEKSPTWTCAYKKERQSEIAYGVARDMTVPQFPLDEARHLDRSIVEIKLHDAKKANCAPAR